METTVSREKAKAMIGDWRKTLLDLSKRNKLLFFKSGKATRIQIVSPTPEELLNSLVDEEKSLEFPFFTGEKNLSSNQEEAVKEKVQISQGDFVLSPPINTQGELKELFKKLDRLRRGTKTIFEEQGVHTLFLALGMLRWVERETNQETLSPLLLLPVILEKNKERFKLRYFEEGEAEVNPALAYYLKINFRADLPEFEIEAENKEIKQVFENFLAEVWQKIGQPGWEIKRETWLAQFAFHKLPMYRDLESEEVVQIAADHPVVSFLCGGNPKAERAQFDLKETEDNFAHPETFPILDADSSQLEVLERVRRGETIVVQGPPGTGKSQTIVNIIGQCLREGKKVLFLSEKRAALEVVFRRLQQVGLTDFCLDLHSHQTNRRNIVEILLETLEKLMNIQVSPDTKKFEEYRALREELDRYVVELHKPRDPGGRTVFEVQGILTRLLEVPWINRPLPFNRVLEEDSRIEQEITELLEKISSYGIWGKEEEHPWKDSEPEPSFFSIPDAIGQAFSNLEEKCNQTLGFLENGEFQKFLSHTAKIRDIILNFWNLSLNLDEGKMNRLFADLSQRSRATPWGRFWIDRRIKRSLKTMTGRSFSQREAIFAVEISKDYLLFKGLSPVENLEEKGFQKIIGNFSFQEMERLYKSLDWIPKILKMSEEKKLFRFVEEVLSIVSKAILEEINEVYEKLGQTIKDLEASLGEKYFIQLFPRGFKGKPFKETPLREIRERAGKLKWEAGKLQEWIAFRGCLLEVQKLGLGTFLKECKERKVHSQQLPLAFRKVYFSKWLEEVYASSPVLREFHYKTQEEIQRKFRELDRELQKEAVKAVFEKVSQSLKKSLPQSEERRLRLEAAKRRRLLPLRRLFPQIPNLLLSLKPCLMMSPLSVATYLPKNLFSFDLLIFDEASQLLPGDALGALLRAKQTVIFGDAKQLPPTDFFQTHVENQEEEEETARDFESILDIAGAYFPGPMLKWHYRSRDERLIAFSNQKFYQGRLVTFPAPGKGDWETGISFIYLPEGIYDRGGSRINSIEARGTAELVLEHFRTSPEKSLGVIAMSIEQRDAIEEALNQILENNSGAYIPENEKEPFFIKNLETVQGDERDVIILSVGYGPNEPRGRPIIHFGPINRAGGERRLNVAITRARYKMVVITSMDPEQLSQIQSKWEGPRLLFDYLRYAKQCANELEVRTSVQSEGDLDNLSEFEKTVREVLARNGYQVDCKVGVSSYKMDLAVKDPEDPQRYLIGIECDGLMYLQAHTVRDRERIRQEILQNLGWNLVRIWSTDWIKNPQEAAERLIETIENCRKNNKEEKEGIVKPASYLIERSNGKQTSDSKGPAPAPQEKAPQGQAEPKEIKPLSVKFPVYQTYKGFYRHNKILNEWINNLRDILIDIVTAESPIHIDQAFQRMLSLFPENRMGARIRRRLEETLQYAIITKKIKRLGDFLWDREKEEVNPRGPGDLKRPPEHIPPQEWKAAVKEALRQLGATPKEELTECVAEEMGFMRLVKDVVIPIEKAIGELKDENLLSEIGDMIYLKR